MDHDIFSCNVTSSFLDDLSEISQEPVNICNYPQTSRLQNSNAYNRELYASQSTMNYYPVASNLTSHQNYQRSNMYNYNFPNYEYNTNIPDQRINMPYIQSNSDHRIVDMQYDNMKIIDNDRMNIQPNNFISTKNAIHNNYVENKYQNYPKYYSMTKSNYQPNQLYRSSEISGPGHNESLCINYQYPPQYFPNGSQSMYYDHGISHFDERHKVERLTFQNIASIDQNIYNLETKLHFLSQNLANNPNTVHEINEIKEKLIYFNQLKEKYLLSRNKLNFDFNNKNDISENKEIVNMKPINNYNVPPRPETYNSHNTNISQFYSRNVNKSYESYMYNFMPNNQQYNEKYVQNDSVELEKIFQSNAIDNSTHKSFVCELTGSEFSQSCVNDKQHSSRDELSTPPISEFTDLTSMMPLKDSHKPNVAQVKEFNDIKMKTEDSESVLHLQPIYVNHSIESVNIQQEGCATLNEMDKLNASELDILSSRCELETRSNSPIAINENTENKLSGSHEDIDIYQSEIVESDDIYNPCEQIGNNSPIEIEQEILTGNGSTNDIIDKCELMNNARPCVNGNTTNDITGESTDATWFMDNQQIVPDKEDIEIDNVEDDIVNTADSIIDTLTESISDHVADIQEDIIDNSVPTKHDFQICLDELVNNFEDIEPTFDPKNPRKTESSVVDSSTSNNNLVIADIVESISKTQLDKSHMGLLSWKKILRNNNSTAKIPKCNPKFKKYYFYLKLKKLHQKYYLNKRIKSRNISREIIKSNISKKIDVKKKPGNSACKTARRMKNVESFLKKKNSRGSYFNNFDIGEMNISKKSLRSSTEFHITTRLKKETNFEIDSNEDNSLNSDDEVHSIFELNVENQNKIVQKILGSRIVSTSDMLDLSSKGSDSEIEEYYLKYRGFSYIHCEWKSAETVYDLSFPSKLKRYKNMKMNSVDEPDECLFNPDYVEIDRVLESKQIEISKKVDGIQDSDFQSKETITYYLVKWRSLPYEEITWEKSENVDPAKVKEYFHRNSNAYSENAEIVKPTHKNWKPITMDRVYKNGNILRDYQLEGVNWLTFCWITNRNCILADEMGLGKTIQSIAFLIELFEYGFKGPFLIIVPLSTLGNWQREFEQWSNLNVILYHGSAKSRKLIQNYETVLKGLDFPQTNKLIFNAIITTYEVLLSDLLFFSKFQWTASIIDEAHRLKNKRCKLIEGLRMLDLQFRVLLTGTPLQNNVQELFNLLNFLESSKFFCESDFLSQYGDLRSEEQVASLKILLQPMMLRRLKEDVEKSLAPKEEIVVEVELTNIQKKYYRAILERNFTFLSKGVSGNNIPNLMNTMMELRKCCNHPFLIKGAEEAILNNFKSGTDMGNITKFIQNKIIDEETLQFYSMVYSSGKLVLIHKLLPKLKQDGHKVLIFSQMVRVLDILEDYLIYEKYQYERIDGRIHGLLRQEAIDRFTSDPEKFVFLLCTKAGGLGINLTAADVVIIYDSDWNPQNDLQAQARCHRIGQQKLVNVYRLITRNTYEREMFDRASLKLGLDKAILQSMTYTESKPVSQLSKKEIEDLLKLGAYGALMDDDKDGEKFCEEDIDKILLSRSTVVRLNNTDRNSSFSKASFSISDNRSDIKLDDPNFWQKWAKKAGVDESEIGNSLIMDKPRLRRQTNRYKPNSTLFDEISGDDSNSSVFDASKVQSHANNKTHYPKSKKKALKNLSLNVSTEIKDNEIEDNAYKPTQDMDRYDLFKAEKCLLQFGWGRWEHALDKISFKVPISSKELELLCKTILQYAHRHYSGDDRIYSFIEDLMLPESDFISMRKHLGYSAPVARGRRGRKGLEEMISAITKKDLTLNECKNHKKNCEPSEDVNVLDEEHSDIFTNISTPVSVNGDNSDNGSEFSALVCPNFRKHIQRTSHKLLHRIQFLYFLNHEIIGLHRAQLILNNTAHTEIPGFPELKLFTYLDSDYLPSWWNTTVDKCLLLGIFKHGWEKYDDIFKDPCFGFVDWLAGSRYPACSDDETDMKNMHQDIENNSDVKTVNQLENSDPVKLNSLDKDSEIYRKEDFPTNAELNIRLRKIIGSFQKLWRQKETEKIKMKTNYQSLDLALLSSEITNHVNNDGKTAKWSRREETEFYRAINSFGIEKAGKSDDILWTNFRNGCNLPRKSNESLTEYFKAFYTMCQKICQKYPLLYDDNHSIEIENISTERASRCLMKINTISKIRNEIIHHPEIEDRIKLCESTNDFPTWWVAGYHDLSILKGIAKYGATRTELSIISDSGLGFKKTILELLKQQNSSNNKIVSADTTSLPQNDLKNVSKIIIKSEDSEDKSEIGSGDRENEIDSAMQSLLDKLDESVYDDIFNTFLIDAIDETIEQFKSTKKEVKVDCSDESSVDIPFDISILSKIGWPKERILFSRLELIVQTIEKGEWPFAKNQNITALQDRETLLDSMKGNKDEIVSMFHTSEAIKTEPQLSTFKSKRRGRKRAVTQFMPSSSLNDVQKSELVKIEDNVLPEEPSIRSAYDSWSAALSFSLSSDPAVLMQKMLQMAPEMNSGIPSSSASINESSNSNRIPSSANGMNLTHLFKIKSTTNGSSTDSSVWNMSQSSTLKTNKNNVRRGRRPKHTGPYEMSRDSKRDSVSRLFNNRLLNTGSANDNFNSNPETIIPIINIFNGTLIYDETAPKRKNLENFLIHNANYMPYSVEEEDQKIFNKVAKSRGQETGLLESMIFTQYMNFMMSTMLASQSPLNIYNSSLISGEGSNSSLTEDQMNTSAFYMQQYQESILSMLGAANNSISGLDLKSMINNNEDVSKSKKRSISPIRNTGIPVKIKSYSISHLTDDDNIETPDENKTPAHSNFTSVAGTAEKSDDKQKYTSSTVQRNSNINPNKVSSASESTTKMHMSNQNSDILASYQAYLYSAMLYSDYISSMQQYSLLNNNKVTNTIPDIFNNFKHPQQNKSNEFFHTNNSQSSVTPTPNIPIELTLSSSNSKTHKRTKVTSFSVESMGITAVVSTPNEAGTAVEPNATSHISLQDVSDDYAVLDLSNR